MFCRTDRSCGRNVCFHSNFTHNTKKFRRVTHSEYDVDPTSRPEYSVERLSLETGDWRQENGDRRMETGDWRQ